MTQPIVFWLVAILLAVWGLAYAGLVVFTFFVATPDHWASLVAAGRIKQAYADYISEIPHWIVLITLLTAATRLAGGIALLLLKSWALPVYAVSLTCMTLLMFRAFILADIQHVIRPSQVLLEFTFLGLSLFAVWFAKLQIGVGRLS